MSQMRQISLRALTAVLLGAGACGLAVTAQAPAPAPTVLVVQLSGSDVVPPVNTIATGVAEVTLSADGQTLSWKLSYNGLSGNATAASFNGPAMPGQNAGIVVPISGSLVSPVSGSVTLAPWQVADLLAGKWYLNIQTAAQPNGEIRGQVVART